MEPSHQPCLTADPLRVQAAARRYGRALDSLQSALDREFGPLEWNERSDPEPARRHDHQPAVRIGAIYALGVPLPELNLQTLSETVNKFLTHNGFPAQADATGSPSGHLIWEASDADGAEFTMLIKDEVNAWIDVRL